MINAPELNFNASIDWTFLESEMGSFSLYLDGVYSSDQYFDAPNTERLEQEGYDLMNGRLSFKSSEEKYTLSLWVRNIADKEYYSYAFDNLAYFNFDYNQRGLPRMFGAEATVSF